MAEICSFSTGLEFRFWPLFKGLAACEDSRIELRPKLTTEIKTEISLRSHETYHALGLVRKPVFPLPLLL